MPTKVPVICCKDPKCSTLDNPRPPVVTGLAQLIPGIDHDLVKGILHQAGEVCRCGKLRPLVVETTMQIIVAGEHQVKLTDTGKLFRFETFQSFITRGAQKVVGRGLQLVAGIKDPVDARAIDS